MLVITIEPKEFYNNQTGRFIYTDSYTVRLEHSLISISKWESRWKKPYLSSRYSSGISGREEEMDYIRCMVIGNDPPEYVIPIIYTEHRTELTEYLADPHTATKKYVIGDQETKPGATITAEIIYYWMIKYFIPFDCEKWHFNRLLALLDVCSTKESGKKNKLSVSESANWRHQLNLQRRKEWSQ